MWENTFYTREHILKNSRARIASSRPTESILANTECNDFFSVKALGHWLFRISNFFGTRKGADGGGARQVLRLQRRHGRKKKWENTFFIWETWGLPSPVGVCMYIGIYWHVECVLLPVHGKNWKNIFYMRDIRAAFTPMYIFIYIYICIYTGM